jgi:hypothetical protein
MGLKQRKRKLPLLVTKADATASIRTTKENSFILKLI